MGKCVLNLKGGFFMSIKVKDVSKIFNNIKVKSYNIKDLNYNQITELVEEIVEQKLGLNNQNNMNKWRKSNSRINRYINSREKFNKYRYRISKK